MYQRHTLYTVMEKTSCSYFQMWVGQKKIITEDAAVKYNFLSKKCVCVWAGRGLIDFQVTYLALVYWRADQIVY